MALGENARAGVKPKLNERKGALTVEAALVMPVLLCAFFTVIFLVKTVCTYELMQHALDETASDIASAGYIYHISGIRDLHDTVRNDINDRSELFRNQISSVFETYDSLKSIGAGMQQGQEQDPAQDPGQSSQQSSKQSSEQCPHQSSEQSSQQSSEQSPHQRSEQSSQQRSEQGPGSLADSIGPLGKAGEDFRNMLNQAETMADDPLDELKSIACYIAAGSLNDAKTQLFTPVVKLYMKKYLLTGSIKDVDQRLKMLNVENGFEGLDFSESSFLSDTEENIDIVVRYRINLILPLSFMPDLEIVQRSRAKAWLGGDDSSEVLDGSAEDNTDDIWSLSNFQRGLKIRRQFGANLPDSFPVLSAFDNGKAVMIKSMDLTAESYQTGDNAEKTLKGYIKELVKYKGQEKPWGSKGIVIKSDSITSREVLLVIPENKLSDANEAMLTDMIRFARSNGVDLDIRRYGTKKVKSDDTDTSGEGNGDGESNVGSNAGINDENSGDGGSN